MKGLDSSLQRVERGEDTGRAGDTLGDTIGRELSMWSNLIRICVKFYISHFFILFL